MKKLWGYGLSSLLATLSVVGCKKAQDPAISDSDVKTIENLVDPNGAKPDPICGSDSYSSSKAALIDGWLGKPGVVKEGEVSVATTDPRFVALKSAASALPDTILAMLQVMGTKVQFEEGIPDACSGLSDASFFEKFNADPVASCFRKVASGDPKIYIGSLSEAEYQKVLSSFRDIDDSMSSAVFAVRHELVRVAGIMYARYYPDAYPQMAQAMGVSAEANFAADFRSRMASLAEAFDSDVAKLSDEAKTNVAKVRQASGEQVFSEYVLAEVFDSRYCNENTKKTLLEGPTYASTRAAFQNLFEEPELAAVAQ